LDSGSLLESSIAAATPLQGASHGIYKSCECPENVDSPPLNAGLAPGSIARIVAQIEEVPATGSIRAIFLDKRTEEIYVRTRTQRSLYYTPKTKFVMGRTSDLHSAAIVHVTARVRIDGGLDVEQFVILPGYVRLSSA
jgi:hypothetical protein